MSLHTILAGKWSVTCYVATHFEGGTQAAITVDQSCGTYTPIDTPVGEVFYFAAVEMDWNYAPVRYDPVRSQSLDDEDR